MNLDKTIQQAKKGQRAAQRALYEQYKVALFGICLRYARDQSEANDILQEGFIKIFRDLKQFKEGSLLAWMRKVMVNAALQYLRKWKKDWQHLNSGDFTEVLEAAEQTFAQLGLEELTLLIQRLPDGYRMVFNLYVIEGYSHKEISTLLGVSVSTSKSQLHKAKAALRKQLEAQLLK